jgi:hypothetical protein
VSFCLAAIVNFMCNLYSAMKSQRAIRDLVKAIRDLTGNLPSQK